MPATLVYTCSNLSHCALQCANLLYESLLQNNTHGDFDFLILTNEKPDIKLHILQSKILFASNAHNYPYGMLKYCDSIPKNYKYYMYLDSDILFYDKISTLINRAESGKFFVAEEINFNKSQALCMHDSDWHRYPLLNNSEVEISKTIPCINAGQFFYKNSQKLLNMLAAVRNAFNGSSEVQNNKSEKSLSALEQSCLNYVFLKNLDNFDSHFLTYKTTYQPEYFVDNLADKTILHFAGFTDDKMSSKYTRMVEYIKARGKNV